MLHGVDHLHHGDTVAGQQSVIRDDHIDLVGTIGNGLLGFGNGGVDIVAAAREVDDRGNAHSGSGKAVDALGDERRPHADRGDVSEGGGGPRTQHVDIGGGAVVLQVGEVHQGQDALCGGGHQVIRSAMVGVGCARRPPTR